MGSNWHDEENWNEENTVYGPINPEEVDGGSERVFCPIHQCWMMQDHYGKTICIVCLVEDRLDL